MAGARVIEIIRRGRKGETGDQGVAGAPGADGADGADGTILPSIIGNALKFLRINSTATAYEYVNPVPSGTVISFAGSNAPTDYLECDGSAVSRTTYADLYAVIGDTYGLGDGSTTFNLPDLRGEFVRGWDNGKGTDSGRALGSTQTDELKSHTHSIAQSQSSTAVAAWNNALFGLVDSTGGGLGRAGAYATGGSETRPRNVALMYCIKF